MIDITVSIEARALARCTDPATSHDAANRVHEFAATHHQLILDALRSHPDGLTAHEIASGNGVVAHQVGKRLKELESAGLISQAVADGVPVVRKTPSGRMARVMRAIGGVQ